MQFIYSTKKVIFSYIGLCTPVLLYMLKLCGISCSDAHLNIARKMYSLRYGYVHALYQIMLAVILIPKSEFHET